MDALYAERDLCQAIENCGRDYDVHTLRRLCLGELYTTLVNTALNGRHLKERFPLRMSMLLRAKTCAFRPFQSMSRLLGHTS